MKTGKKRRHAVETKAVITNIQKFSVHDGPGIRSTLFLKGCPLRCPWCANPENIAPLPQLMFYPTKCIHCGLCIKRCPQGAVFEEGGALKLHKDRCTNCGACAAICASRARMIKGEWMTAQEVRREIDQDLAFYRNSSGGVTFSGGEPMLHPDFIVEIASAYKRMGLNSAVETCGYVPWSTFEQVLPWVDLFLYDLKFMSNRKHLIYCGSGNDLILSNLSRLCGQARVIVRIPIIPGINDTPEDLRLAGEFLANLKDRIEAVHCLPYHNMGISKYEALHMEYYLPDVELPKPESMNQIKAFLEQYGLRVQIGG